MLPTYYCTQDFKNRKKLRNLAWRHILHLYRNPAFRSLCIQYVLNSTFSYRISYATSRDYILCTWIFKALVVRKKSKKCILNFIVSPMIYSWNKFKALFLNLRLLILKMQVVRLLTNHPVTLIKNSYNYFRSQRFGSHVEVTFPIWNWLFLLIFIIIHLTYD